MIATEDISARGMVLKIRHGDTRINRGFTYGYMVLTIRAEGGDFYDVVFSTSKFGAFGFIPKTGHWVEVEGKVFPARPGGNPSIKWVSKLRHIEDPTLTPADRLMRRIRGEREDSAPLP